MANVESNLKNERMKDNLVSIITPMYNGAKYIGQTIESVLSQTYKELELIVIDDGSKDDGSQIVEGYMKQDDRIYLLSQKNAGSAAARNNGIRTAKGRYIALLDADDLWDPIFLESQLLLMKEKSALVVCASYRRIDENSREIMKPQVVKSQYSVKEMQQTNRVGCLTGLYDTKPYGKMFLNESMKSMRDDYAYWLDIVTKVGKLYGNEQIIASYRVFTQSATGKKRKLIKPQFLFYYRYQRLGILKSIWYTVYWAFNGLLNFGLRK